MQTKRISPWSEHSFWLEILEDHAYFVRDHLSPAEEEAVKTANQYIKVFHNYRMNLKQISPTSSVSSPGLISFSNEVWPSVNEYFQFERNIQSLRILNEININLTPSFITGTLSENLEYIRILSYYVKGKDYPLVPISEFFDLWLQDQIGHAVLLYNVLDPTELKIRKMVDAIIQTFQGNILQSRRLRIISNYSPSVELRIKRLSLQVFDDTMTFYKVVEDVIRLYKTDEILTRTTLRFLEHHIPETCYFVIKLSEYVDELKSKVENCPLTKPSFVL